jgi:hypothetical protein
MLLSTEGALSWSPARQQCPKNRATALICTAVSQRMNWQDDCMLLAETAAEQVGVLIVR